MSRDDDARVRAACALALGRSGALRTFPRLVLLHGDRDREVRRDAYLGTGLLGDSLAADHLRSVILDPRVMDAQRASAALALGLLGGSEAVRCLEEFLDPGADARVRGGLGRTASMEEAAVAALGLSSHEGAAPLLRQMLASGRRSDRVRSLAATGLGRLGDRGALPLLVRALRGDSEVIRAGAAVALGLLAGPDDRDAVAALAHAARDDRDATSRRFAQISLGRTGCEDARAALRRLLGQGRVADLPFTALALGVSGDRESAPALRRMFRDGKDPSVRGAAAVALGLLGDREAAPDLLAAALSREAWDLRGHCFTALGLIGHRPAMEAARRVLREERHPAVVLPAATFLGMLGDRGVLQDLEAVARSGCCDHHRAAAFRLLGLVGNTSVLERLADAARDREESLEIRAGAVAALGELLDPRDLPRLAEVGMDGNFPALREPLRMAPAGW